MLCVAQIKKFLPKNVWEKNDLGAVYLLIWNIEP